MNKNNRHTGRQLLFAGLLLSLLASTMLVSGDPAGATITSNSTDIGPVISPDALNDARGTINTILIQAVQQDQRWKAYTGNVSGTLNLDDANQFTIYRWDVSDINGQVYASRNDSLDWSSTSCAPHSLITSESTFFGMSDDNSDDINSTFNYTAHKAFQVGSTNIGANSCNSTALWINDTAQAVNSNADFQEVLITDAGGASLIFMTSIDNNIPGYDNNLTDFQMIVPEATAGVPTTYYFYVELR